VTVLDFEGAPTILHPCPHKKRKRKRKWRRRRRLMRMRKGSRRGGDGRAVVATSRSSGFFSLCNTLGMPSISELKEIFVRNGVEEEQ
jgi:hypothetical protein